MKIPIPDDWDGETWDCVQIQWPSSNKWFGLLAGLLTQPTRGRMWDERTGSIIGIQAVGFEIDERNLPFTSCGETTPPTIDKETVFCFAEAEESDFLMSLCGYNPKAFKIENGILYVRDFCGDWVEIGATGVQNIVDDPDPYIPPPLTGGGYSACGKATAVMDMVYGVIESILDEVGNFSWTWWGHVKNDNPGVGMDAKWIILACEGAVNQAAADAAAGDAYDPNALDPSTWQSVKCKLALQFSDDMPEPLGGNEIRSKLQDYFASEWGIDLLTNAIFVDALRGINRESFESAVALGANYDEGDCDCPDVVSGPTTPTANGWYLSGTAPDMQGVIPYDEGQAYPLNDWGWCWYKELAAHDIYGCVATLTLTSGSVGTIKRANDPIAFMGIYDHYLSGSNSDSFGNPLKIAQMNQNEFDELGLAAQGYTRVAPIGDDGYAGVASPPVTVGQLCLMAFSLQQSGSLTGVVTMTDFRWLHNTGSPNG